MNEASQQWISLGLGGLLVSLVGWSIYRLIGAWSSLASEERHSSSESRERATVLQEKLNAEIAKRAMLEVEVKYLKKDIEELRAEISALRASLTEKEV